jgi:predicted DCC family thiol-disulfide oxidoreductase YuxK
MTRPVVLYDADCKFCRFAARTIGRLDRHERLALLPLGDAEAEPLLADVPVGERLNSLRLAEPDGRLLSRSAAVKAVAAHLGAPTGGLDRAYDAIASRRTRLGRLVPDGIAPRRFP